MTEPVKPDDRELEQYLKGEGPLSRRYRDASGESSPPDLDEAILARSRAELKRKPPSLNRYLAPVALAASVVLGVNLAWNLRQVEPVPLETQRLEERLEKSAEPGYAPEPPPVAQQAPAPAAAAPEARRRAPASAPPKLDDARPAEGDLAAAASERKQAAAAEEAQRKEAQRAMVAREAYAESQERKALQSADAAGAAAPSAALAPAPPPLTEAQKIDRLVGYVGTLEGAVFIRNDREHTAADAAKHMQLKRDKAGERCDTAEEFIRVCASFSSRSGEAYLIRFPDGRTRTAEDVLREQLAAIERR
jgi:hypothetical protein